MPSFLIAPAAKAVAEVLLVELKAKRIAAINIDIIRAACAIGAHFDDWSPDERLTMEDAVLRQVVERA